nr:uncharacterized protein LOC105466312 isoform X2 [Macaca nemestrina]
MMAVKMTLKNGMGWIPLNALKQGSPTTGLQSQSRIYHERLQNPGRETDWATCYSEFQLLGKLRWRGRLELGTGEA